MSRIVTKSLVATLVLGSAPSLLADQANSGTSEQLTWTFEDIVAAVEDEPEVVLGVFDGPDCEVFGSITDAAIDLQGRVFVLDAQNHVVTAFTSQGECLFQVGREGQGPGELASPRRISISNRGVLSVLDPGNARFERFDVSGSDVQRLSSIPLLRQAIDFCHLDDRLFVATMQGEEAIHEAGEDGRALASFGSLHESDVPAVRAIGSPHILLCHQRTRSLVLAARHLPAVHRYTMAGERAFAGEFPGFVSAELVEADGGVIGFRPSPEGMHFPASAIELDHPKVLLQSGPPWDIGGMFVRVNTALLDVEAGVLEAVEDTLPHVFAVRGPWLVAARHEEFPRIGIWKHPDKGLR